MSIAISVTDAAAISTYSQLIARVIDQTDGRVTESNIPTYIRLAEAEMNRRLAKNPVRPMRTREAVEYTTSGKITQPTRYLKTDSLSVTDGTKTYTVDYIEPESLDALQVQTQSSELGSNATEGRPLNYTDIGTEFCIYPVPTQSWSGFHTYYKRLTPLADSANSNWMLTDHPDVYYTGTLAFAYHYLPDKESSEMNMALFDALLDGVLDAYPKVTSKTRLRAEVATLLNRNRNYRL